MQFRASVVTTYTRDQVVYKLLSKEVLIEDYDVVVECKLSTENKLTFFTE